MGFEEIGGLIGAFGCRTGIGGCDGDGDGGGADFFLNVGTGGEGFGF